MASLLTRFLPQSPEDLYAPVPQQGGTSVAVPPQPQIPSSVPVVPAPAPAPLAVPQLQDTEDAPIVGSSAPVSSPEAPPDYESIRAALDTAETPNTAEKIARFVPGRFGRFISRMGGPSKKERIAEVLRDYELKKETEDRGLAREDREMKMFDRDRERMRENALRDPGSQESQQLRDGFEKITGIKLPDGVTAENFPLLGNLAGRIFQEQGQIEGQKELEQMRQANRLELEDIKKRNKRRGRGGGGSRGISSDPKAMKDALLDRFKRSGVDPRPYMGLLDSLTGNMKRDKNTLAEINRALPTTTSQMGREDRQGRDTVKYRQQFRKEYQPLRTQYRTLDRALSYSGKLTDKEMRAAMTAGTAAKVAETFGLGGESAKKIGRFRQLLFANVNPTLKERSGAAVTENEMQRFFEEYGFSKFGNPQVFRKAMKEKKRDIYNDIEAVSAIYPKEVVDAIRKRGGAKKVSSSGKVTISYKGKIYRISRDKLAAAKKDGAKVVK